MKTRNMAFGVLKVVAIVILSLAITHKAYAAELTLEMTVEVSNERSVFDVSVYPGKAGYDNGIVSGDFGDGTVLDYRFLTADADTVWTWADGGAGIIAPVPSPPAENVSGGAASQRWADVWITSDPDVDPADFTDDTQAAAQNLTGTIDISGLDSGVIYVIYGSYQNPNTIFLTMSGSGQSDIQASHTEDPPLINKEWISKFVFSDAGAYDTITYSYTNTDTDGSRARFMGVVIDSFDPNAPSVDAGVDWISWSGRVVDLAPSVVNNDSKVPQRPLSYEWIADPNEGVVFTPNAYVEAPSVTYTKAANTGDATVVTLTLNVSLDGGLAVKDTATIDVYDNSCDAAVLSGIQAELDVSDFNKDCVTDFADILELASAWLTDYSLQAATESN